jgi:hypothetical protein
MSNPQGVWYNAAPPMANVPQQNLMSPHPFPIDLVYLWVDGADPKWLAKRNAALEAIGKPIHNAAVEANRFDDSGELKFSLRSVQKYLPWINHIYIITDDQRPAWLNTENPRISLVDHRDIVPAEFLPTFNASALEMFIHRVPGLAEHFIFANDDMFVGAPLNLDFFFNAASDPIVMMREKWYAKEMFSPAGGTDLSQRKNLAGTMVRNGVRLVFDLTGQRYHQFICHAMEPMRKSYLADIFAQHGAKIIPPTATMFRESTNIQRIFFPLYNHAKHRTDLVADWRFGTQRVRLSAEASRWEILWRAFLWASPFCRRDYVDVKKDAYAKITRANPALFCVNDSTRFAKNIGDMEKLFPQKSEFEK